MLLSWTPSVLFCAPSCIAVVYMLYRRARDCCTHTMVRRRVRPLSHKMLAGPVLNLSFLMDHVMEKVKPLLWDAVLDSPIPLKVLPFRSPITWYRQLLPLHCMYGMQSYRMYGMPLYCMYGMQLYRMYGMPLHHMYAMPGHYTVCMARQQLSHAAALSLCSKCCNLCSEYCI